MIPRNDSVMLAKTRKHTKDVKCLSLYHSNTLDVWYMCAFIDTYGRLVPFGAMPFDTMSEAMEEAKTTYKVNEHDWVENDDLPQTMEQLNQIISTSRK